jgi:hypothetical protein
MHPDTKYYAYIYYGQGGLSSSSTTSKVEFTTTNYTASFPTANEQGKEGAIWSDFYAHKNNSVVIEYKADEKFFVPMRVYYNQHFGGTGSIRIKISGVIQGGSPSYGRFFKNLKSVHSYEFYGMPDAPDILLEAGKSQIWDMMLAPDKTYNHLSSKYEISKYPISFSSIEKNTFKTKLVSE